MQRPITSALCLLLVFALPAGPALAAEPGVAGLVTDASGAPVAGAVISLVDASAPDDVVADTTTDGEGAWQLDADDGYYLVHASDPSGAHADEWWEDAGAAREGDLVEVVEGTGPRDLLHELPEAALVRGTVRSPEGPVADVVVRIRRAPFSPVEARTDAGGAFRLGGLRAGSHTVEVDAGDLPLASASEQVEVDEAGVAELAFELRGRPVGVERVAGEDRIETAVAASRAAFVAAPTVVLASAGSFPDALAASPLAASVGGPLLLVGQRLSPIVARELARLTTTEVIIVGAIGAAPLVVQEDLAKRGIEVRRIAGEDRFDTAALIAREVGSPDGRAIVASGAAFPDALSVAPYAAAEQLPIVLTPVDGPHPDTAAALTALGVTASLVVGGTAVVSDAAVRDLPSPTRIAGATRYETSLAIAEYWATRGMRLETVSVATGRDFPDALAAGPVAALARGPLLLVDGRDPSVPGATYAWLAAQQDEVTGAYAFGGEDVLTAAVLARLREAIGS